MAVKKAVRNSLVDWILQEGKPWVRVRALEDLLDKSEEDPDVVAAREAMVQDPQIRQLVSTLSRWPGPVLKRHNDAAHPLHILSTLADFGMVAEDPGIEDVVDRVMAKQSAEGNFLIQVNIPETYGGSGEDQWAWMLCDAPTVLYALLSFGREKHPKVEKAVRHLTSLVQDNGWPCAVDPELGKFRGPGRKADPCPYANLISLKALSLLPKMMGSEYCRLGTEALLWHWEIQKERKVYMFGIGGDFRNVKYPFIWYDILHVVDVLSRYPRVHGDPRFQEMVSELLNRADDDGRFRAQSMYRAWKDWDFADKARPSPWLTFLALRVQKRMGQKAARSR